MFISRKKYNDLKATAEELLLSLETLKKRAILIGIERTNRVNTFTFVRDGHIYKIETMGLLGDDLPTWKQELLR